MQIINKYTWSYIWLWYTNSSYGGTLNAQRSSSVLLLLYTWVIV